MRQGGPPRRSTRRAKSRITRPPNASHAPPVYAEFDDVERQRLRKPATRRRPPATTACRCRGRRYGQRRRDHFDSARRQVAAPLRGMDGDERLLSVNPIHISVPTQTNSAAGVIRSSVGPPIIIADTPPYCRNVGTPNENMRRSATGLGP